MNGHFTLPNNLTSEDFNKLANREPDFEGSWLYKVEQAFFTKTRRRNKFQYPRMKISHRDERYFLTYKDAVEFVRNHLPKDLYCTWLTQVPVGKPANCFGAAWLFDWQGELIDCTVTYNLDSDNSDNANDINTVFFGRPQHHLRFKKGDIVEYVCRDEVTLAVVDRDVTDVERCWGIYNRCREEGDAGINYILDYSDESMIVIDGPSFSEHFHVSPLYVIKPRFPIPPELEAEMNTWIERAEQQEKNFVLA